MPVRVGRLGMYQKSYVELRDATSKGTADTLTPVSMSAVMLPKKS
jgi:hypothetical protein